MVLLPALAVTVPAQVPWFKAGVDASTRPAGSVSTNADDSEMAVLLLLPSTIDSVLVAPGAILLGENDLLTVGNWYTTKDAVLEAARLLRPCAVTRDATGIELL